MTEIVVILDVNNNFAARVATTINNNSKGITYHSKSSIILRWNWADERWWSSWWISRLSWSRTADRNPNVCLQQMIEIWCLSRVNWSCGLGNVHILRQHAKGEGVWNANLTCEFRSLLDSWLRCRRSRRNDSDVLALKKREKEKETTRNVLNFPNKGLTKEVGCDIDEMQESMFMICNLFWRKNILI